LRLTVSKAIRSARIRRVSALGAAWVGGTGRGLLESGKLDGCVRRTAAARL
jgi:hypothetical protein